MLEGTTDDSDYVIRARVSNVELGNLKNPLDSAEQDAFRAAFGLGPQEFERYGVAARKVITLRDRSFMPAVAIVMKEAPLIQRELADELGVKRQTLGALMSTARKANSIHAAHVDLITKTLRDITDVLKDEKYDNLTIEGALYAAAGYITLDPAGGIDPTSMPFKSDGADCPLCVEDFKAAAEFRATFIAGHDTLFNADGTVVNNINGSTTQFTRSHRGKAVKRQRPR